MGWIIFKSLFCPSFSMKDKSPFLFWKYLKIKPSETPAYDPNEDTLDPSVYSLFTLDQVMVSNPVTVDPNTPILEVAELFSKSEFHSAPVVEDGILVGIVTTIDLIRFLIDQYWSNHV